MQYRISKCQDLLSIAPMSDSEDNKLDKDKQMIRDAIREEYKAISLYEIMSNEAENEGIKKIMLDIAKEEKVHVAELEKLLIMEDKEHEECLKDGYKEIEDKLALPQQPED